MKSLQAQVSLYIENNIGTKLKDLQKKFPNKSKGSLSSCYYRYKNTAKDTTSTAVPNKIINMEMTEALLMDKLKANPDTATLRLIMDFLKIKQQDQSELKEIDLEKFYKIGVNDNND